MNPEVKVLLFFKTVVGHFIDWEIEINVYFIVFDYWYTIWCTKMYSVLYIVLRNLQSKYLTYLANIP